MIKRLFRSFQRTLLGRMNCHEGLSQKDDKAQKPDGELGTLLDEDFSLRADGLANGEMPSEPFVRAIFSYFGRRLRSP